MLPVACCVACRGCSLHIARCMAHVRMLCVARCVSSVAFSLMHVACRLLSVTHFPVVVCGIAVRWILSASPFSVACRTFSVACFRVPAPVSPVSHGVRRLSPGPTSHLVCCMCCVASRIVSLVCCLSHLACRHTITLATHTHTRTHARTHAHLGLQQVSPATEALNCERRSGSSRARG
jgi:hypothetical protein